ncbi:MULTISPECIES: four helix bundle protein [Emticicia]|uniref:four helix bundle protein n=1 Tax=Emticicia TaxID=312278 RepID=UPI0020A186F4|nr:MULTISPECIES: four helix bundle protein [Emticicia]UTA69071.1 four helix bundle protein [Emticicia sp. 21SJ11W-3]
MKQRYASKYSEEERFQFAETLEKKLKSFTLRCIEVYRALPLTDFVAQHIGKQLVRSSTSSATNYRAVRRARSQNEFFAKLSIVVEEIDESVFWLEMLIDLNYFKQEKLSNLITDSKELLHILSKSRKNTYTNG